MAGKPKPRHPVTQPQDESYRLIPLTKNQNAIVDAADFEWLSQWNWFAAWSRSTRSFYATRNGPRPRVKAIRMHRAILGCGSKETGDHINHDTLDNRRKNLRKCTSAQNCCNRKVQSNSTSGYKGVFWTKSTHKWRAKIAMNRQPHKHLGYFHSPEDAARAYDAAARKLHGEFAVLNFPDSK